MTLLKADYLPGWWTSPGKYVHWPLRKRECKYHVDVQDNIIIRRCETHHQPNEAAHEKRTKTPDNFLKSRYP
jgi:hypothetical protein